MKYFIIILLCLGLNGCSNISKITYKNNYYYEFVLKGIDRIEKIKELNKTQSINDILLHHKELEYPYDDGFIYYLPISQYCPYCGAFSYCHHSNPKNFYIQCCVCGGIWEFKKAPEGKNI